MNLQTIKEIARKRGYNPGRLTKVELIRYIQREEGNFDCYGTALTGYCDQYGCLWREDCLDLDKLENKEKPAKKTKKATADIEDQPGKKVKVKVATAKSEAGKERKSTKTSKAAKSVKPATRKKT